ncbi:MAG: MBOAT family protein [Kiritimatiellae bacterium]|nr:MBOAT family protein [Kiritimatiellia bacterium]
MVFGSLFFLTAFLPPVLLGHWALQALAPRWRRATAAANLWLLAASLAACFLSDLRGLPVFFAVAFANDLLARAVAASRRPRLRKALLALALGGDVALLCVFKFGGALARWTEALAGSALLPASWLVLPLGMSFWIFRAMAYVWDVERGVHPPARNPLDFLCWMALFPIFVSGPIVRWADVAGSFRSRPFSAPLAASGFRRLFAGLAKKVLVANNLAPMADAVWAMADAGQAVTPGYAALAAAAYSLQLYFDFSGYSDMAIGLGRLLGFDFKENFLWPYASASVREFWRRWHVSLSSWFRDYLYIPLGGSRRGTARTCLNVLVVFALCGVWHGTGWMFPLWGLWHGLALCAERLFGPKRAKGAPPPRRPAALAALRFLAARAWALAAVAFGWILFRSATPGAAGVLLRSLAGLAEPAPAVRALVLELSPLFAAAFAAGALLCFPVVPALRRAARRVLPERAAWTLESLGATALGAAALPFLASGTRQAFLYFQF